MSIPNIWESPGAPAALLPRGSLADSLRSLTAGLGLKEESAEIAEPVHDLQEVLAPTGATTLLIHHAGKGRSQEGAVSASSGNPALPAAASQIIQLKSVAVGDDGWKVDPRRIIATEGRSLPLEALIECIGHTWVSHGSAAHVRAQQAQQDVESKLNLRQVKALRFVRERFTASHSFTTAADLAYGVDEYSGAAPERSALRNLEQLEHKRLLQSVKSTTLDGHEVRFWPVGHDCPAADGGGAADGGATAEIGAAGAHSRAPARGLPAQVSDVSDPIWLPDVSNTVRSVGSSSCRSTSDTSDTSAGSPLEGCPTPLDPQGGSDTPRDEPYDTPERIADIRNERLPQHVREQRDADRLWEQQHLNRSPEPDTTITTTNGLNPGDAVDARTRDGWYTGWVVLEVDPAHAPTTIRVGHADGTPGHLWRAPADVRLSQEQP